MLKILSIYGTTTSREHALKAELRWGGVFRNQPHPPSVRSYNCTSLGRRCNYHPIKSLFHYYLRNLRRGSASRSQCRQRYHKRYKPLAPSMARGPVCPGTLRTPSTLGTRRTRSTLAAQHCAAVLVKPPWESITKPLRLLGPWFRFH